MPRSDSDDSDSDPEINEINPKPHYPSRTRQREIPGAIPWDSIQLQIEPSGSGGKYRGS